jgi:hypothetical protein
MDRAQVRRRAHVGLTLIADDLIGNAQLLQQPQHALGAGIVEMMDGEHGIPPGDAGVSNWRGGASRAPESRDAADATDITRT